MFLKVEKCLQNFAGVFWEELRRKDTVKPKADIFTNAFLCGFVVVCFFLHHSGTAVCRDEQIRLMVQLQSF